MVGVEGKRQYCSCFRCYLELSKSLSIRTKKAFRKYHLHSKQRNRALEDLITIPAGLPICFRDIGPGSQQVSSMWRVDWLTYMASKKGYVIVLMDVSGSGFSGDKTRKSVHRHLTVLESQDVLHIIRWDTGIYFH